MALRGARCLRALRAHMIAKPDAPPAIEDDGSITIDGANYSGSEPTGYKSSRAGVGVYVLEAVVLMLRTKKASDYVRACLSRKIKAVVTTDQSDLRAFVTGAAADSARLEDAAGDEPPVERRPADEAADAPAAPDDAADADPDFACRSLGDRNHALVCTPGRDFSFAVQLFDRYLKREKEAKAKAEKEKRREKEKEKEAAKGGGEKRKSAADDAGSSKKRKPGDGKPSSVGIIIVPNAPTALVTLLNAADLFERHAFATVAEKRRAGAKKEPVVKVRRTLPGGEVQQFKLVDDPRRLSESDWKRVVAVVAQGAAWQFKGWKVARPVDIFHRYLGVHFKYDDQETASEVKKWNVTILTLNKHKRHLDSTTAQTFWRLVDGQVSKMTAAKAAQKKRK